MATRKKAPLGKNLNALLGKSRSGHAAATRDAPPDAADGTLRNLPIEQIRPGEYQPRTGMDPDRLDELAESIKAQGVVQPVVVRSLGAGKGYELIAGERRWRASQKAGLSEIPAVIRDVPDEVTLAMALIENIQRENLNPIEEAGALARLIEEFELTHEQAAANVGRSRAAVSNLLRLLDLEPKVRALVDAKKIDMGHARALLALSGPAQLDAARQVVNLDLSVRQTEALVKRIKDGGGVGTKKPPRPDPDIQRLEQELTETLCAPVSLRHSASGKGQVTIRYTSLDELDGLLERFRGGG
ncbi:ParB/RepB/Spo0J family partition protein [Wenzhouxiangella sp. XN79A]|uniref:ParB/RepB/Spo0J family partition protein n=1 Tax=Wenzhouxiangella sp. XN79A TaxID=2724193 RepID=UPI00144A7F96|nr:ParB/RepB/Spo0J family partition protein [Wenzhouxiangella sp. XN79A]NKI36199.1 ParB/RepB/Spo0J family partition protein [Wenzhouxiangella sp. XN79A]